MPKKKKDPLRQGYGRYKDENTGKIVSTPESRAAENLRRTGNVTQSKAGGGAIYRTPAEQEKADENTRRAKAGKFSPPGGGGTARQQLQGVDPAFLRDLNQSKLDAGEQPITAAEYLQKDRKEQFGAEPLKQDLEQGILNQPDLTPELDIQETIASIGLKPAEILGNAITGVLEKATGNTYGRVTSEDLAQTTFGKYLGLATAGTAGALAVASIPAIISSTAVTAVTSALGSSAGIVEAATAGLGVYLIGGKIFDYKGGEINSLRGEIGKIPSQGEKLEASVRNGLPPETALETLNRMNQAVIDAETRIRELGVYNLEYRASKEYLQDKELMSDARLTILRRVEAIENIIATGQSTLNPGELIYSVEGIDQ